MAKNLPSPDRFHFLKGLTLKMPRSRKACTALVADHATHADYRTCSYSINIKCYRLVVPASLRDVDLYAGLDREDKWDAIGYDYFQREFTTWCPGFSFTVTGRSGGHLVLGGHRMEPRPHTSYCTRCGQPNFNGVLPPEPVPISPSYAFAKWLVYLGCTLKGFKLNELAMPLDVKAPYADLAHSAVLRVNMTWTETERDHLAHNVVGVRSDIQHGRLRRYQCDNVCGHCHKPARVNYPEPNVVSRFTSLSTEQAATFDDTRLASVLVQFNRIANQMARSYIAWSATL